MVSLFKFLQVPLIDFDQGKRENSTNEVLRKQLRRNPFSHLLPLSLRRSKPFRTVKRAVRKLITPSPPGQLRDDEREFLEDELRPDIEWSEFQMNEESKSLEAKPNVSASHAEY